LNKDPRFLKNQVTIPVIRKSQKEKSNPQDAPTIKNNSQAQKTPPPSSVPPNFFHGYSILRPLPSTGSEADIFLVTKEATVNPSQSDSLQPTIGDPHHFILRLYRYERAPKPEITRSLDSLSQLLGDRVVRVLERNFDSQTGRYYEIQEYLPLGDLRGLFSQNTFKLKEMRTLLKELNEAIEIIHKNGLIHRDIKPSNILIRSLSPLSVALGDFGIASVISGEESIKETQIANTPLYCAPEGFTEITGKALDYWSLGVVLLESLSGSHPYDKLKIPIIMREILTRGIPIPKNLPPRETNLLKGLLTRDDKKRWKGPEIRRWLAGDDKIPIYWESPKAESPKPSKEKLDPQKSYRFGKKYYSTLKDLAPELAKNHLTWDMACERLKNNSLQNWLKESNQLLEYHEIERDYPGTPEEKLFSILLAYAPELGQNYLGIFLSFNNIVTLVEQHPSQNTQEKRVLQDILQGKLKNFPKIGRALGHPFCERLETILSHGKEINYETLLCSLLAYSNKDSYVWGTPPKDELSAIKYVLNCGCPLLKTTYLEANLPPGIQIPEEYFWALKDTQIYNETVNYLKKQIESGNITNRTLMLKPFPALPEEIRKKIKPQNKS
jgi:serine/threonine protein kinase